MIGVTIGFLTANPGAGTKKSVPDDPARREACKGICFLLQTAMVPTLRRGSFAREATLVPLPKPCMKSLFI
jgi:hypothetical protein